MCQMLLLAEATVEYYLTGWSSRKVRPEEQYCSPMLSALSMRDCLVSRCISRTSFASFRFFPAMTKADVCGITRTYPPFLLSLFGWSVTCGPVAMINRGSRHMSFPAACITTLGCTDANTKGIAG